MGIFGKKSDGKRGFTIVEIMVVVSVIGILAAIVTVAYPMYQRNARNNDRKNDLAQMASALKAYALQKNNYMTSGSGCGFLGEGNGWVNLDPATGGGFYPKSVAKCFEEAGLVDSEKEFMDPSGCRSDSGGICGSSPSAPTTAYMKAVCTKNSQPVAYFMVYLEGQPRKDAEVDALCDPGSLPWFNTSSQKWGTNYGMNYYVTVN